ncbi:hypothetical protein TNIN_451291 [Trichonephila inaurata madagascariensis]|uniref:Uncharacterized protein n=1 Tax=Trichonephila inaurata madagascariensis TaxID=2747483 RepID=A0A8X7CP40_9ARAC|nr:hypothetical protein TNIN_451291 [Trichonephila inaurata madagascariensis]
MESLMCCVPPWGIWKEGECLPTDHPSDLPPPMHLPRENSPPSVPPKNRVIWSCRPFSIEALTQIRHDKLDNRKPKDLHKVTEDRGIRERMRCVEMKVEKIPVARLLEVKSASLLSVAFTNSRSRGSDQIRRDPEKVAFLLGSYVMPRGFHELFICWW